MKIIESKTNKSIKWLKKLNNDSKQRKLENLIVVETKKIFETLLENNNVKVLQIFATKKFFDLNKSLLKKYYDNLCIADEQIINYASNLKTSDGLIAVAKSFSNPIEFDSKNNYLALYNIQDPKNLGSIIRSALSFNFKNIFLIGSCADFYSTNVIRASMGYIFKVNTLVCKTWDYFLTNVKKNNINLVALDNDKDSISLKTAKIKPNSCFIIGSEGQGLDQQILKQCNQKIKIDISNQVESLNATVAASIVMYHIDKND